MHDRTQKSDKSSPAGRSQNQPQTTPEKPIITGALTPASILQLQRLIGNKRVAGMLQRAVTQVAHPAPFQRPPVNMGLAGAASIAGFVDDAWAYITSAQNADESFAAMARYLNTLMSDRLEAVGVEPIRVVVKTSGNVGEFNWIDWCMNINTNAFSTDPNKTTVGQLTQDEAGRIVDTIYHESRHAEQWFRMAQIKAGEGWSAERIESDMQMHLPAAITAAQAPIGNPDDDRVAILRNSGSAALKEARDTYKQMNQMYESVYGADADYRSLILNMRPSTRELYDVCQGVTAANFNAKINVITPDVNRLIGILSGAKLVAIDAEIVRVKAIENRSVNDTRVLNHLNFLKEWVEAAARVWNNDPNDRTAGTITQLGMCADKLKREVFAAYSDLPEEMDAIATGNAAGAQYRAKQ